MLPFADLVHVSINRFAQYVIGTPLSVAPQKRSSLETKAFDPQENFVKTKPKLLSSVEFFCVSCEMLAATLRHLDDNSTKLMIGSNHQSTHF